MTTHQGRVPTIKIIACLAAAAAGIASLFITGPAGRALGTLAAVLGAAALLQLAARPRR